MTRLAKCLSERGADADAQAIYRRVLEIEPSNSIAQSQLRRARARERAATEPPRPIRSQQVPGRRRPSETTGLIGLHERLDHHFRELGEQRARRGSPIFALEHDLTPAEMALLVAEVHTCVRNNALPRDSWLPFVVYTAEVGYKFSGDEYWPTFQERTPHWSENGDPYYVREKFRSFAELYGGARPEGRWAKHFSIICWPITHAGTAN